jgi:uncharacterized protein (DUF1015 family)
MVEIAPFQGYRYDIDMVSDFKLVVSPPYDVISSALQKKLLEASPYNIAHIIKGEKYSEDDDRFNEHCRASLLLESWIKSGALRKDDTPSIYVLAQDFEIEGVKMTRSGFIALIKLEDMCSSKDSDGTCTGVHQHEETLPKDIEDRLNLLRNTKGNFGLIFSIYSDEEKSVDAILEERMKDPPLMQITDEDQITHRLWAIENKDEISKIQEVMKDKYIIIADGHHRYKTALKYSKEHPDSESAQFRMLAFVNTTNKGLVILPTHRLVQGVEDFDCAEMISKLKEDFTIEDFAFTPDNEDSAKTSMFKRLDEHFPRENTLWACTVMTVNITPCS